MSIAGIGVQRQRLLQRGSGLIGMPQLLLDDAEEGQRFSTIRPLVKSLSQKALSRCAIPFLQMIQGHVQQLVEFRGASLGHASLLKQKGDASDFHAHRPE
jgi:hypothetical protein